MSAVQFLAQADCSFQNLLQHSSEARPNPYPKKLLLALTPTANFL